MSDHKQSGQRQSRVPVGIALALIGAVWIGACVISFAEQIKLAEDRYHFEAPWLFPVLFDGLASALAVTSWSAALDGRHSPVLRLFTCVAVGGSAWVNAEAVRERTLVDNWTQIGMAVAAPLCAWIAFEFLLGELRRQIMRARGVPAPAPVPALRPVRVLLSPFRSIAEWRRLALDVTDPRRMVLPDSATDGDRSGSVPGGTLAVPAPRSALSGTRNGSGEWSAVTTQPMEAVTGTPPAPALNGVRTAPARSRPGESTDSGTPIMGEAEAPGAGNGQTAHVPEPSGTAPGAPAPANGTATDDPTAPVPAPADGTDGTGARAAAQSDPGTDRQSGTDRPDGTGTDGMGTAPDPAEAMRARGATVPEAQALAAMDDGQLREAAEAAWRQAAAAGHEVSGALLGTAFGRSDRWGRARVRAVREADRGVISLVRSES
jgi:hypothetical protein